MLKGSRSGPLKVCLLTISPHNRAILEFFFAGAGRNLFKAVPAAEADAFILDNDYPGAKEDWSNHQTSNKPALVLSVHAISLPNTIWIPKPLTSKALTEAVDQIYSLTVPTPVQGMPQRPAPVSSTPVAEAPLVQPAERFSSRASTTIPSATSPSAAASKFRSLVVSLSEEDEEPVEATNLTKPATSETLVVFDPAESDIPLEELDRPLESTTKSQEELEQRWKLLCGERDDINSPSTWQFDAVLFTPENYILHSVQNAFRIAKDSNQAVKLNFYGDDYALFMPEANLVHSTVNVRSDKFAELCNKPIQTGQIALHIPSSSEFAFLETQANSHVDTLIDMEAFVWITSLLTAKGRLTRGVDINRSLVLKHWPNMTRLEQFPHLMRVAALWNQRPGTLFDIAKALRVPQRYVFSFYTAANNLNLFEVDQTKHKRREKEKPKESRGLFARLLTRLLGGGAK